MSQTNASANDSVALSAGGSGSIKETGRPNNAARTEKLWIVVSNLLVVAMGLVTSVITSRYLNPTGRGQLVSWQSWTATLTTLSALGHPQLIVTDKQLPRRLSLGDLRADALALSLLALTTSSITIVLLGGASVLTLAGAACMAITGVANSMQVAMAQRAGAMGVEFNLLRLGPQFAAIVACLVLLALPRTGPSTWFVVISAFQLAATLLAWGLLRSSRSGARISGSRWRASLGLVPVNWVTLLQYRADLLLVTVLFPKSVVAFYSIGSAAQGAAFAAGQSGGMHWFGTQGNQSLRRSMLSTLTTAGVLAVPIAVGSWALIPTVYGEPYRPAVAVALLLTIVAIPLSLDYLLTHVAMKDGTHQRVLVVKAAGLMLLVIAMVGARALSDSAVVAATAALAATVLTLGATAAVVAASRRPLGRHHPERRPA